MAIKIGIDVGNADTKLMTLKKKGKFKSTIQTAYSSEGDVIELPDGRRIQVSAGYPDISNDKTHSLAYQLLVYKGMAEGIEEDSADVHLLLDLPLLFFYNTAYREELMHKFLGEHVYKYNGKNKRFNVVRVDIYPQGLVALFAHDDIDKYVGKVFGIVDIGGLTVDATVIDENLNPITDSMFSINQGTIILENNVKTRLNQEFLTNLQSYQIPDIIRNGGSERIKNSDVVIAEVIEEYFNTLKREMNEKNWSIETLDIVGIGGGALLLKDYLELNFNYIQSPNPQFDNVLGLWNVGMRDSA